MSVQNGRTSIQSEHRRHDRLLVTRFAMGDAYPSEDRDARQLLESCADCAALAKDIRLISTSVARDLPRPVRKRDFMITAAQAEKLRGNRLSRWLGTLSAPGWGSLRPVAGVALSIGLVMAVVGAAMPGVQAPMLPSVDSGAGVPVTEAAPTDALAPAPPPNAAATPEFGAAPGQAEEPQIEIMADASQDPVTRQVDNAYVAQTPGPAEIAASPSAPDDLRVTADPTRELLIYAGLGVAVVAFGLLVLAWAARRYVADPLLR